MYHELWGLNVGAGSGHDDSRVMWERSGVGHEVLAPHVPQKADEVLLACNSSKTLADRNAVRQAFRCVCVGVGG